METLINEKNEAFRRIKEELTPRINGEIGVSVQEKIECEQERAELSNRIAEIDAELANAQELPPEEVKAEPILSTVDGLPLEVFTKNEDAAILIRCEVESLIARVVMSAEAKILHYLGKATDEQELNTQLKQRISLLENDYDIISEICRELTEENERFTQRDAQLTLERDQALLYRDNAKAQLEDMAFEFEQNRIELNRNREVRALTEAERTAEQEAARQRFLDSRIKIYNPRNADELNSRERIANLAETGEEITYLAIYEKGTYVEITEDEALAIQAMNKPVEIPEVESQEEFQSEDASAEESLSATEQGIEQQDGRNNQPAVGEVETFEERTERRLTAIERRLDKDEPVVYHEVA